MDSAATQSWFTQLWDLAVSPYGGAFMFGLIVGLLCGWYLINKYLLNHKLTAAEELCNARISALEREIAEIKPIAAKWNSFMERKALESLERT